MKLKATTEANQRRALRESTTEQQANLDVIRTKFLEQSAKYLGVYYESKPAHWLDDKNTLS